jgi:hypothetical protein
MPEIIELPINFITTAVKLLMPGGVKVAMAETIAMKQQLIVMNRVCKRSPALATRGRFLLSMLAMIIGERSLQKVVVSLKPATILESHKALVKRKYSKHFTNRIKKTLSRKA